MIFKDVIKNIRANESLGYLCNEKELLTSHNLTIEQLTEWSVSSFTFDFSNKEIVTIHIILDYVNKFIIDNIGKSVLETELTNYNIKLEQLVKECNRYDILDILDNRVMFLIFKDLGTFSIILEAN